MADLLPFHLFRHNPPSIQYSGHHQPSQPVRTFQQQNSFSPSTQQVPAGSLVVSREQRSAQFQQKPIQDIWASQPDKAEVQRFHHSPSKSQQSNPRSALSAQLNTSHSAQSVAQSHNLGRHGNAVSMQQAHQHQPAPHQPAPPQQHPYSSMQTGVGIEFESGRLVVASLLPGCSAERSTEIQSGDEMVAVEGYEDLDLSRARSLILGRQGTFVNLAFRRKQQRFKVRLMRGTSDYLEIYSQCQAAEARVRELEDQVSKLVGENDKLEGALHATRQNNQQQEYAEGLQARIQELEQELQTLKQEKQDAHDTLLSQKIEELRAKTSESDMLHMQVSSLQKLIGEKDGQVTQTKAKAREQQTAMANRVREAEEALKDKVAAKNETIANLNKQLEEVKAELEQLRAENKDLRDDVRRLLMAENGLQFASTRDANVTSARGSVQVKSNAVPLANGSAQPGASQDAEEAGGDSEQASISLLDAGSTKGLLPGHGVKLKAAIVPKLPLSTLNQGGGVQTFQHVQQQVQFQEPPSSSRREGAQDPVPDLQVLAAAPPHPPQRQLLNDPPTPYHRDLPAASSQPWGVKPALRSHADPLDLGQRLLPSSGYPAPAPAPSPVTPKERKGAALLSPASGSSQPSSPGDVHLSHRPGPSRIVSSSYSSAPSYASSSSGGDVSFRNRLPTASSPYSLPSYGAAPPPMASFSMGSSYSMPPAPLYSPSFNAPWGRQW